ncbi:hypothetical protein B0T26DRAFT_652792 [Lasiosphaeria miniovina]|uniref:Rhodopsin domain-containing protein n=1 Tax=Lasiosphaeria miniovina TaxID=1954250 RepID=A0AA40DQ42_9PEZI|nr:uncharacterized protein B0T26DRAFT_652792 [Lasiosphaeria miniovina]KAK0709311.1 hypothetical protein B0T26DRAFT_652792 [Lasiosphaeria miniovina]
MGWVDNASPEIEAKSEYRTIISVVVVLTVLAIGIVSARLWIRIKSHGMASDDWMAVVSMACCILYSIACIVQTKYGLGLGILDRPKANLIPYTRWNYGARPFYQLGISFFKIALLISYLRLFQGTNQVVYRRVVWSAIVLIFLGHLGCTFALVFACNPVDKSWNPLTPGSCLAPGPSFAGYAIVTIISDVVVAVIPIPVLLKLKVSTGKKIGLIVIFLLGLFTTLCSVFRYLQINRIQYGDGNSTLLVLWGVIEFNVGNMVSSLPFLAPVFVRKAKEYRDKYGVNAYGSNGGKMGKSGDAYKLGSVSSQSKSAYASAQGHSTSEENILKDTHDGSIMKSVTYSVHVDEASRKV